MTLGIWQPYLLPYIGYWQLFAAVDRFVLYDNLQYSKQGWINRNRFLRDGTQPFFTVPLKKASDYLNIADRTIADDFEPASLLNAIEAAYGKAPFFEVTFPLVQQVIGARSRNLFEYLHEGIRLVADHLHIRTPVVVSSTIRIDHSLKAQDKVLAICEALGASRYLNGFGGRALYSTEAFAARGVELKFLQRRVTPYEQFGRPFVPDLSIVDVLMFNSPERARAMLLEYDLV